MLRLLADENFNGAIVRGLVRGFPALDILTVQQAGLASAKDPDVLEWAAKNDRVLLTHDVSTIPGYVRVRAASGLKMPGVIEVASLSPIGRAIEDILVVAQCSLAGEWEGQIVRVPL